ncbi:MAG: PepSY-associated TM helix domain-containing protein [Planctomycetes bacterium]|nr:PepSY-associated TM helix domain-containing protein [Planctomycetota bacterium]
MESPSPSTAPAPNPPRPPGRSSWNRQFAAVTRWLHIYVSMLAFTIVLFFAVTGLTLNHADWFFANEEHRRSTHGQLNVDWVRDTTPANDAPEDSNGDSTEDSVSETVKKLEVVEHLRKTHAVRGALSEFSVDDQQCIVIFKGPGYSADVFIERATGSYEIAEATHGVIAVLNDLHKGRDSGPTWSWVIDVSAVLTAFISVTGLILLFYLKRRRAAGLWLALAGTVLVVALFYGAVP